MAVDMTVRIYFYGMMLMVPAEGDPPNAADYTLTMLLADGRDSADPDENHRPAVLYCTCYTDNFCTEYKSLELAEDHEFEQLEYEWTPGRDPTGVVFDDSLNGLPPTRFPESKEKATDFDWVVSIGDLIGANEPVSVKESCSLPLEELDLEKCPIVSRLTFREGEVETCDLVRKENKDVPAVKFVSPGRSIDRAMAQIMVIELRRSGVDSLTIKGAKRGGAPGITLYIGPGGMVKNQCPMEPNRFCADVALVNLPPSTKWNAKGLHFRHYYDLVVLPPEMLTRTHRSHPMVLLLADSREPEEVDPECSPPFALEKVMAGRRVVKVLLTGEDRPICPVGTP